MNSLLPKLEEKLALDDKTEDYLGREYAENFETTEMLQAYSHYLAGLNMESARLTDVHKALVKCVEALERYCTLTQRVKMEDGKFETIDSGLTPAGIALQYLREVLDESPK